MDHALNINTDDSLVEHTTDKKWNVRTAVHEYGDGSYAVYDGIVVFSNWSDQGLYLIDTNNKEQRVPRRICECNDNLRYAAATIHPSKKFLVAVREDHREVDLGAPATLVAISLADAGSEVVLFDSHDFVSTPVFSPKNDEIAFYAWNHPGMNWDATTLFRATIAFGSDGIPTSLVNQTIVVGKKDDPCESVYQPRFGETGRLYFLSHRNTYHIDSDGQVTLSLDMPMEAEFGPPKWAFGISRFQAMPGHSDAVLVTPTLDDKTRLGLLNVNYGDSTGKGRNYRERLYLQFGVIDMQGYCAAALYLANIEHVDRKRLRIMGGSASGFTTLACVVLLTSFWKKDHHGTLCNGLTNGLLSLDTRV
ncbi:hypothetical protein FBU59_000263 [Linderina macrospora]|uniref:Uncharacterized protein n=1 Tax=Linderina macrospora TaxID=4868 RepID=A0ACC1JHA4_9FUNG|nr:hypothetical protein FBU59_000263 [Linderina macrospora]